MSIKVTIVPVTPYQQNCSLLKCEETGRGALQNRLQRRKDVILRAAAKAPQRSVRTIGALICV